MLSDVMDYYGLAREFQYAGFNVGYFETEHLNQIFKDICAAIHTGGFIMLTGPMGSGKTAALLRVRRALQEDKEGKVLVSRSLATDKERITLGILMDALFFDLSGKKEIKIPTRSERRERELQIVPANRCGYIKIRALFTYEVPLCVALKSMTNLLAS